MIPGEIIEYTGKVFAGELIPGRRLSGTVTLKHDGVRLTTARDPETMRPRLASPY